MILNVFASEKRLALYDALRARREPPEGEYDAAVLKEAQTKGEPQVGATRYEPQAIVFEFIYPATQSAATVVSIRIQSPERIVFLPVPEWVVETIWQGEIAGSPQFESHARELMEAFLGELEPEANAKWFSHQLPKRS